jgi:RNA polymerase primary sigma factor
MKRVHQKELKSKRTHARRAKAKRLRHRGRHDRHDRRSSTPRALRPEPEAKPEAVARRPLVEEEVHETPEVEVEVGPTTEELEAEEAHVQDTAGAGATDEVRPKASKEVIEVSNAYSLYLREIGQTKLLTPQEEIKLAARIKRGDERAREEMIKANLRLVVKIAREYEDYGVPLLDLINEGNIGLMKAVERFDPAKGAKLSTYAAWWIKQAIRRALSNQSKTIRLPVHVGDKLLHMRRAAMKLQEELGREPTDEELGQQLQMTALRVAELRSAGTRPSSLDAPIGGDDDSDQFADIVKDERADTPYQQLEGKTNTEMIRELIERLPEREATILRYRFGLDGDDERTLEEVGQRFGVTRERIRQLQNIALNKLRKMIQKREAVKMAA